MRGFVASGLGILFLVVGDLAQGQMLTPWFWLWEAPTIPPLYRCGSGRAYSAASFDFPVGCYDTATGAWLDCETFWREYVSEPPAGFDPVTWSGGHFHSREGGELEVTMGVLFSPLDPGGDLRGFSGVTGYRGWVGTKSLPEASGVVRLSARYRLRSWNHVFVEDTLWRYDPADPSRRTVVGEIGVEVAVRGLQLLPDSQDYAKVSDHEGHALPFYGNPRFLEKLVALARAYRGRCLAEGGPSPCMLAFNDLSLPLGGLYDIGRNWSCPHVLHRYGASADVKNNNRWPVNKTWLVRFAKVLGLYECHPNSRLIHVDIVPCGR